MGLRTELACLRQVQGLWVLAYCHLRFRHACAAEGITLARFRVISNGMVITMVAMLFCHIQ